MEEPLKLLPLVLFGTVGWNRIRRWSASDFALAAAACGAGFNLCEDLLRRVATEPGALSAIFSDDGYGTRYGWTLFPGWWQPGLDEATFAGHGVTSGLVGAGIGLAVVRRGRGGWQWLLPLGLLTWVTYGHMAYNNSTILGDSLLPGWATTVWNLVGDGAADRYLLLALLVILVVVDYRAMLAVASQVPQLPQRPTAIPDAAPPTRFLHELSTGVRAFRRGPGTFISAMRLNREQRELAIGVYRANNSPRRLSAIRQRIIEDTHQLALALFGAAAALAIFCSSLIDSHVAGGISAVFLAGLFGALADWWNGMSTVEKALAILGILAVFSGGGGVLIPRLVAVLIRRHGWRYIGTHGRYLYYNWYIGTFDNRMRSILYHAARHGRGRDSVQYTKDAMRFFNRYRKEGTPVTLRDGTPGIRIRQLVNGQRIGGYWTRDGRLVTFWD